MNEYPNRASLVHRIDIDKPVIPMKRGLIPSLQRKTSRSTTVESRALLSRRAITKSTAQMGSQNVMKRLLSRCERSWAASSSYRGPEGSSTMRPKSISPNDHPLASVVARKFSGRESCSIESWS